MTTTELVTADETAARHWRDEPLAYPDLTDDEVRQMLDARIAFARAHPDACIPAEQFEREFDDFLASLA